MIRRPAVLVLALLSLSACGASLQDRENEARGALNARDWAKATQLADAALQEAGADKAAAWRLEQIRLEALAGEGKGAEVASSLERLAGGYAGQVTAALYRSLGDKLKAAGDTSGAIDVLAAGDKRFPDEHDSFQAAIDALKAGSLDPAEIEKLKALGYL